MTRHSFVFQIHEQYSDFISLEPNLFSLNTPKSYITFNHPTLTDADVRPTVEGIVNSLFSTLLTMVPSHLIGTYRLCSDWLLHYVNKK